MSVFDFIVVLVCIFFTVQGLWKGFIRELFGMIALLAGLAASSNFFGLPDTYLQKFIASGPLRESAGFAIVFLAVWFSVKLMGYLLSKRLEDKGVNMFSHLAGGVIALAKIALVISAAVYFADQTFPGNPVTRESKTAPTLLQIAEKTRPYLPFLFKPPEKPSDSRKLLDDLL